MMDYGCSNTTSNNCVFIKRFSDRDFIIFLLYVDNMLSVNHNARNIENLKRELSKSFVTKNLWPTKQILAIRITHVRKSRKLWLSQEIYQKGDKKI